MKEITNNQHIIQSIKEDNRMKTLLVLFTQALCVAMLPAISLALVTESCGIPRQAITIDGRLNCPTLSYRGGTAYLLLSIATSDAVTPQRKPMNLSIVLDRSGSMGDEGKMEYAKKALYTLIDQLTSEDIVSIVIYDDIINVLREASRVGNKQSLKRAVEGIYPRGSTNLGGGMMEGFRQVERNVRREYVNRVVLLSDGLANQGITDPHELSRIARRYRAKSISLTTMGVGLDYNENLMVGLSESGGGNYYFIERPTQLASIVRKEFDMLSSVVAQNATIELTLGRQVHINDVIGCEYRAEDNRQIIPVGDLYSNDRRELTVELAIPEGTQSFTVATGVLRFESKEWTEPFPSFSTVVHYSKDVAEVEKNRDLEAQGKADVALSTRHVERAMKALDEGNGDEAAKALDEAAVSLSASPAANQAGAAGAAIRSQVQKMESYRSILKDSVGDARKAKKSIQYDNYQTQKSK
jgi:Ca-activated chloride channel family protein